MKAPYIAAALGLIAACSPARGDIASAGRFIHITEEGSIRELRRVPAGTGQNSEKNDVFINVDHIADIYVSDDDNGDIIIQLTGKANDICYRLRCNGSNTRKDVMQQLETTLQLVGASRH